MTPIRDKHITVVGLGKTGQALAGFLKARGAKVTAVDRSPESALGDIPARLRRAGVEVVLGEHDPAAFESSDLIVLSPGVPHSLESVVRAQNAGVPVTGEIELASWFVHTPIVAVTGTNGKTTVTRLIGEMLKASGLNAFVGGNLGTPLISYAHGPMDADVVVAEISSFQLDTADTFHPRVGVLLNISADHLDRYPSLRAYGRSKAKLFARQTRADIAVLNRGDDLIMELTRDISALKCLFNQKEDAACGAWIGNAQMRVKTPEHGEMTIAATDMALPGRHNLENAAAAALAALAAGASREGVLRGLREFVPDPHRLQYVGRFHGVDYYDDSKATNVDAVVRAVAAVSFPVVLILGGRDKGGGYENLVPVVKDRVRALVLLGEASAAIERELGGLVQSVRTDSMDAAVAAAANLAEAGDTVLLSPACASFDLYDNYAQRGEDFQRAVKQTGKRADGSQADNT